MMQPITGLPPVQVGDIVCTCTYEHLKVIAMDLTANGRDYDLTLEDGSSCSLRHCADVVPHEWVHPQWHRDADGEIVFE